MKRRFPIVGTASSYLMLAFFFSSLPVIIFLISSIAQTRSILLEQIQTTHANTLTSYITQIDHQLHDARSFSIGNALPDSDLQQINAISDENEAQYAYGRIFRDFENQLFRVYLVDGIFAFFPESDVSIPWINVSQNRVSMDERHLVQDYLQQALIPELQSAPLQNLLIQSLPWELYQINGVDYLIELSISRTGVISGTYVRVQNILGYFEQANDISLHSILDASQQIPSDHDILLIECDSSEAPVRLTRTLSRSALIGTLPFFQQYIALIAALLLLLLLLIIIIIRKVYISPLRALTEAMEQVQNGNLAYRISEKGISKEFRLVNETFNAMLDQVQSLKISVYEEKLKVQHSRLRNLQLQINPHFLINTLTALQNLILQGQTDLACELIHYSATYFRYMMKVDEDFVSLHNEIEHEKIYLEIQSIRYNSHFTYEITSDPILADMLIPPMTIHSFIENSMKYALDLKKCIHLSVRIRAIERDHMPYAEITIHDTGDGYPPQYLDILNRTEKLITDGNQHIGIRNTLQRLTLLFHSRASWRLYNQDGAVSELILPVIFRNDP